MQSQDKQKLYDYSQKLRDMIQVERDLTLQCSRHAGEAHQSGEYHEAADWDKQALEHCVRRNALSEALDAFVELNKGNF